MNVIRKHYRRPQFIPDDSESSILDWIFVGGYGKGAQMHVSWYSLNVHLIQLSPSVALYSIFVNLHSVLNIENEVINGKNVFGT